MKRQLLYLLINLYRAKCSTLYIYYLSMTWGCEKNMTEVGKYKGKNLPQLYRIFSLEEQLSSVGGKELILGIWWGKV